MDETLSGTTTTGQYLSESNENNGILHDYQNSRIGVLPSNVLKTYPGHSPRVGYLSVEMQFAYSTAIADWAVRRKLWPEMLEDGIPVAEQFVTRQPKNGGARGVVVIAVGNEHGDTSSNPGRNWLHFT